MYGAIFKVALSIWASELWANHKPKKLWWRYSFNFMLSLSIQRLFENITLVRRSWYLLNQFEKAQCLSNCFNFSELRSPATVNEILAQSEEKKFDQSKSSMSRTTPVWREFLGKALWLVYLMFLFRNQPYWAP